MGEARSAADSEPKAPDGGLIAWLRYLWRRMAGPPPQLLLSDIVSPEALPICPECTERYHPLAHQCHECGELVGPYRAWIYPDLIWIWGRGLWRLMERHSVSRLVWVGMVVLSGGWFLGTNAFPWPNDPELRWLQRPLGSMVMALTLINVVAGLRMLAKAWRMRGTWRRRGRRRLVSTAARESEVGGEEG